MGKFSYQDLELRLSQVEDLLDFVKKAIPITVQSATVDISGRPRRLVMPLGDAYRLLRQNGMALEVEKKEISDASNVG